MTTNEYENIVKGAPHVFVGSYWKSDDVGQLSKDQLKDNLKYFEEHLQREKAKLEKLQERVGADVKKAKKKREELYAEKIRVRLKLREIKYNYNGQFVDDYSSYAGPRWNRTRDGMSADNIDTQARKAIKEHFRVSYLTSDELEEFIDRCVTLACEDDEEYISLKERFDNLTEAYREADKAVMRVSEEFEDQEALVDQLDVALTRYENRVRYYDEIVKEKTEAQAERSKKQAKRDAEVAKLNDETARAVYKRLCEMRGVSE